MMLYPNGIKFGRLRSWRGRHKNFNVNIKEVFNDELKVVDKYSIVVYSTLKDVRYDSAEENVFFNTVDIAKNAAIKYITDINAQTTKDKTFRERPVYLQSCNIHNFRHGEESPSVIGLVRYTPVGLEERLCFKVKYESDGKIDYIAHSEWLDGNWQML